MKRVSGFTPMDKKQLLDIGFDYHDLPSSDGSPYFLGDVAYEFTSEEIDQIEDATNEAHEMCLDIVVDEVKKGDYENYNFTDLQKELIETSWKNKAPHFYGRFDFGFDGKNLKLFEYNADTPTSLLEASVAQWEWLCNIKENKNITQSVLNQTKALASSNLNNLDQFNSIHECMIDRLKQIKNELGLKGSHFHISGMMEAGREDWGNLDYLCDVAYQAGFDKITQLAVEDIGYNQEFKKFVDLNEDPINLIFKLYPLEWLSTSDFAQYVNSSSTVFLEPMWKMLLSNKVLLPKLWSRFKGNPLLLPSYFKEDEASLYLGYGDKKYVKKPILGREGANISYIQNNQFEKAKGSDFHSLYDENGFIYQELYNMPNFDGMYPVIGSWVVGDQACGIGLREDFTPVTGNDSHFVPHYFIE